MSKSPATSAVAKGYTVHEYTFQLHWNYSDKITPREAGVGPSAPLHELLISSMPQITPWAYHIITQKICDTPDGPGWPSGCNSICLSVCQSLMGQRQRGNHEPAGNEVRH